MKYFSDCHTIEDVKKAFKDYVKKLHPDAGGNEEEFKRMMSDYDRVFNLYKNIHVNKDGETYTSEKKTAETSKDFSDILCKVIFMTGVKIEIIGSWVWLSGNTMVYKDQIKEAGFIWSKSKKAWYYTGEKNHYKRRGHYTLSKLREKWGSIDVENENREKITA